MSAVLSALFLSWPLGSAWAQTAPVAMPAAAASAVKPDARLPLADPATTEFVSRVLQGWYVPRAVRLAERAAAFEAAATKGCGDARQLAPTRQAWLDLAMAWTELSAVPVGPLLSRNSETRMDFHPLRLPALDKAIATPRAAGAGALDTVGAQARGLQALEWLLWKKPLVAGGPACAYLGALARDLAEEGRGLAGDFSTLAQVERSDEAAALWFNDYLNQWLGGMAKMRWRSLELPVRSWGLAQAPRAASGSTAQAWAVQWAALGGLVQTSSPAAWMSLSGYFRARGLAEVADAMLRDAATADQAMRGLNPASPTPSVLDAARKIDLVTYSVSKKAIDLVQIQLEFTAEDGD